VSVLVNGLAFLAVSKLLPGFKIGKPETAFIAAAVYSLLNWLALKFLGGALVVAFLALLALMPILALMAAMATPMMLFLLAFGVAVGSLVLTDHFLEDFEMDSMATAVIGALMLSVISTILRVFLPI
jgi:uncharacterized membrane protein YvlD (DUF360 family)